MGYNIGAILLVAGVIAGLFFIWRWRKKIRDNDKDAKQKADMEMINNEIEGMKKELKEMSKQINEVDSNVKIHFTKN